MPILKNKYDIVINGNNSSSSGKLAVKLSRSKYKFYNKINNNLIELDDYYIMQTQYITLDSA